MRRVWSAGVAVVMAVGLSLGSGDAWAKRLGGGTSMGKQSPHVSQREGAAPAAATPANPGAAATAGAPSGAAGAAGAAAAARPAWGGMLGGLAAGLGLAWLASSLGLGEAFAQVLLMVLLAGLLLAAATWFVRRRPVSPTGTMVPATAAAAEPATPRGYSPLNVGNDASARPWERSAPVPLEPYPGASSGSMIGSSIGRAPAWGVPAGFDVDGFLAASRANFVHLQDAWDRADIPALRAMMTDDMVAQIQTQLAERERHTGSAANRTEVVMLEASLLGIEELPDAYMASVEFSGLIREEPSAGPSPFREVWNVTRDRTGPGGWLVAGVQALQ